MDPESDPDPAIFVLTVKTPTKNFFFPLIYFKILTALLLNTSFQGSAQSAVELFHHQYTKVSFSGLVSCLRRCGSVFILYGSGSSSLGLIPMGFDDKKLKRIYS
jgi:hypothetical protein